ncbi:hypothetical protein MNBD_GAMMA01-1993, partial [hydrothermal vent metagenome]
VKGSASKDVTHIRSENMIMFIGLLVYLVLLSYCTSCFIS